MQGTDRQGALSKQECRALTTAIKGVESSTQQTVGQQQQVATAQQTEPSEAESRLLKPVMLQVMTAAGAPLADEGMEPGLQVLHAPGSQRLHVIEGQLPCSLDESGFR